MKEKLVPSAWIEKQGRRLDCGPYLSGAVEARLLLDSVDVDKLELQKVTLDLVNAAVLEFAVHHG